MAITLTVTDGPHRGVVFTFEAHDTFLVGRARDAHLVLPEKDPYFSRHHFLVEVNPPLCRLVDMKSRNGTRVNGQRVQTVDLQDGDEIRAGHTTFRVALTPADDNPLPAPAAPLLRPEDTLSDLVAEAEQRTGPDLLSLLRDDQAKRWQRGEGLPVEAYVQRLPGLGDNGDRLLDLIYHEFMLREERGDQPLVQEYLDRFPQYADSIRRQFEVHQVMQHSSLGHPVEPAAVTEMKVANRLQQLVGSAPPALPCIPGYELLQPLGEGGMGVVFRARHLADGTLVAIKTIVPALKPTEVMLVRFLREADILKQLNHPHIVAFRATGYATDRLYFVTDLVEGIDAHKTLQREGPLPVQRAVTIICQLLDALVYAHGKGFVHRDVKPGNLLLTPEQGREVVKLADFGLARAYQGSQLSGLTMTGTAGGTPGFMPPEQVNDFRSAQPAADQYSAAATLYALLTAQPLYDGVKAGVDLLLAILQQDPVPVRSRRPDLPADLAAAIHRALSRKPSDRFADVGAFRQALLAFAG